MGSIKDRNGIYLTEAEDIKKRWQEYTEELYKEDLQTQRCPYKLLTILTTTNLDAIMYLLICL